MPDYYDIEYEPEYQERRSAYRVVPSPARPLSAWLYAPPAETIGGHVLEMSGQGMGIAAPAESLTVLSVDRVVELSVGSDHADRVVTPARIVSALPLDDYWARYGVLFVNVGGLYPQLDAFFQAHFNRRRHVRARPLVRDVVRAQMNWDGGQLTARVNDVSDGGMALSISPLSTLILSVGTQVALRFRLPGVVRSVSGRAEVRYVAELPRHRVIGLAFDLEDPHGIQRDLTLIQAFVAEQAGRVEAWEQTWTS